MKWRRWIFCFGLIFILDHVGRPEKCQTVFAPNLSNDNVNQAGRCKSLEWQVTVS